MTSTMGFPETKVTLSFTVLPRLPPPPSSLGPGVPERTVIHVII